MARTVPQGIAPPTKSLEDVTTRYKSAMEHRVELSTMTPMFGGSTNPKRADSKNPIAARTVRGHLRFWWRALNGHRFSNTTELAVAEGKVWGTAAGDGGGSRVAIEVEPPKSAAQEISGDSIGTGARDSRRYGAYGLRSDNNNPAALGVKPFSFALIIACSDEVWTEHVEPSLAAWIMLGGVGARWRRGFGSLRLCNGSVTLALPKPSVPSAPPAHSMIPEKWLLGACHKDPEEAWKFALQALQQARSGGVYRSCDPDNSKDRGVSPWPEANTLRRLERKPGVRPDLPDGFPRADLGLPLTFFAVSRADDPATSNLLPEGGTRMASPVVVKAITVPDTPGQYRPLMYLFDAPHVWDRGLRRNNIEVPAEQVKLSTEAMKGIEIMNGVNAREAVLDYAYEQLGFREYPIGVFR